LGYGWSKETNSQNLDNKRRQKEMDIMSWFPLAGFISAGILFVIAAYILLIRFMPKLNLPGTGYASKKKDMVAAVGAILLIVALLGGGWNELMGYVGQAPSGEIGDTEDTGEAAIDCPATGYTSVTIDIQNALNDATLEEYDASVTCVGPNDNVDITDTTDPNGSNFVCGDRYTCYITSTAGAAGDGSVVQTILSGKGTVQDGNLVFTASGAAQHFQLGVNQIGVTEARMWDVMNAGWMYDTGDASGQDYETDGATFTSTTDNATAYAIGAGGEAHVKVYFRSTASDNALNDRGLLFAVDADATKYKEPTVVLDNSALTDMQDSLTAGEKIALSGYEYVYLYDGSKAFEQTAEGELDFGIFALEGVDPGASDDIQIDIIPRGQKASSLDATSFIQAAYDDSSSHTVVLQVDDYTIDVS
jgi:hypothetical protein